MRTSDIAAGIIGIALVGGFLGVLMWWLKSIPLTVIMLGVIGLMICDVVGTARANRNGSSPD